MNGSICPLQTGLLIQSAPFGLHRQSEIYVPYGIGIVEIEIYCMLQGSAVASVAEAVNVVCFISRRQETYFFLRLFHKAGQVISIAVILLLTIVEVVRKL